MMGNSWWVINVDFRISTGIIFFFILILFGGERKKHFPVRIAASALLLCSVSWVIRYWISCLPKSGEAEAYGYSVFLLTMALMYYISYRLVYSCGKKELIFRSIIGFIIYRLAWCALKMIMELMDILPGGHLWSSASPLQSIFSYAVYFSVVAVALPFFKKFVRGETSLPAPLLTVLVAASVSSHVILDWCMRVFGGSDASTFLFYFCSVFYCMASYTMMLYLHQLEMLRREYDSMQDFLRSKQQYYEISREGILSLQTKCHDLKHQIALIRSAEGKREFDKYVEDLETSINEYNTVIQTGNTAIDVILTEKNIVFNANKIKFSYILDGTLFSFMPDIDIYALFGNALDNAIEGAMKLEDPTKRIVSLRAGTCGDFITLHIENSFDGMIKLNNGIPITTKPDSSIHGFGMRSLIEVAEKYGGSLSFEVQDDFFILNIILTPEAITHSAR